MCISVHAPVSIYLTEKRRFVRTGKMAEIPEIIDLTASDEELDTPPRQEPKRRRIQNLNPILYTLWNGRVVEVRHAKRKLKFD